MSLNIRERIHGYSMSTQPVHPERLRVFRERQT